MSREEIAEIYDHLAELEANKALKKFEGDVDYESIDGHLARGLSFRKTARSIREVDAMKPLRPQLGVTCEGARYVRAESNIW
jgi:hypothetical protein